MGDKMSQTNQRKVPELSLLSYKNGGNTEQAQFVDQLYRGLVDYGFVVLTDHPVEQKKVDLAYELAKEFFALPTEVKNKYCNETLKKQRGYIPFGMEHAKGNQNPDLKEFWHTGRDLAADHPYKPFYPDNVWPTEVSEFQKVSTDLYKAMDETSVLLLEAIGQSLDVPKDYFTNMVKDGNSILRTIHYPPVKGMNTKSSVRAAAHGDINLITMLVGATDSGLELLDRDGSWLAVDSTPGQIVVDTGDMMSRITNEVMPSTIHRVVNPPGDESTRFSMPFFVHPHPEADLSCIPSCRGTGEKYPPIKAHDFLLERLKDIGLM
jgi:isopenicillin N synthase-like dioxygenase